MLPLFLSKRATIKGCFLAAAGAASPALNCYPAPLPGQFC